MVNHFAHTQLICSCGAGAPMPFMHEQSFGVMTINGAELMWEQRFSANGSTFDKWVLTN